jgi:hypothetical protein
VRGINMTDPNFGDAVTSAIQRTSRSSMKLTWVDHSTQSLLPIRPGRMSGGAKPQADEQDPPIRAQFRTVT